MERRVESSVRPRGHRGGERWKERPAAPGGMSMSEPGTASERDVLLATKLHVPRPPPGFVARPRLRSEEHTSELQSRGQLVCRLLLEKKKKKVYNKIFQNKKKHKENYL